MDYDALLKQFQDSGCLHEAVCIKGCDESHADSMVNAIYVLRKGSVYMGAPTYERLSPSLHIQRHLCLACGTEHGSKKAVANHTINQHPRISHARLDLKMFFSAKTKRWSISEKFDIHGRILASGHNEYMDEKDKDVLSAIRGQPPYELTSKWQVYDPDAELECVQATPENVLAFLRQCESKPSKPSSSAQSDLAQAAPGKAQPERGESSAAAEPVAAAQPEFFVCPAPGCGKTLKGKLWLTRHVNTEHPELVGTLSFPGENKRKGPDDFDENELFQELQDTGCLRGAICLKGLDENHPQSVTCSVYVLRKGLFHGAKCYEKLNLSTHLHKHVCLYPGCRRVFKMARLIGKHYEEEHPEVFMPHQLSDMKFFYDGQTRRLMVNDTLDTMAEGRIQADLDDPDGDLKTMICQTAMGPLDIAERTNIVWQAQDDSGALSEEPNITCTEASLEDVREALFPAREASAREDAAAQAALAASMASVIVSTVDAPATADAKPTRAAGEPRKVAVDYSQYLEGDVYMCPMKSCERSFTTKTWFKRHVNSEHPELAVEIFEGGGQTATDDVIIAGQDLADEKKAKKKDKKDKDDAKDLEVDEKKNKKEKNKKEKDEKEKDEKKKKKEGKEEKKKEEKEEKKKDKDKKKKKKDKDGKKRKKDDSDTSGCESSSESDQKKAKKRKAKNGAQEEAPELEDAPEGHIAHKKVVLNTNSSNARFVFHYKSPDGIKISFQTTVTKFGGSNEEASRITRLCYMMFEKGSSKEEVTAWRDKMAENFADPAKAKAGDSGKTVLPDEKPDEKADEKADEKGSTEDEKGGSEDEKGGSDSDTSGCNESSGSSKSSEASGAAPKTPESNPKAPGDAAPVTPMASPDEAEEKKPPATSDKPLASPPSSPPTYRGGRVCAKMMIRSGTRCACHFLYLHECKRLRK